jgi:hypothetical protein
VKNTADVTGGKPIAFLLQSISGVSAINPLVAFYDIHGGRGAILLFCPVHHTRQRDIIIIYLFIENWYANRLQSLCFMHTYQ